MPSGISFSSALVTLAASPFAVTVPVPKSTEALNCTLFTVTLLPTNPPGVEELLWICSTTLLIR